MAGHTTDNKTEVNEDGDPRTNSEYIEGATNAIIAISGLNLMTKKITQQHDEILYKSMKILLICIDEYYNELFDKENEDD